MGKHKKNTRGCFKATANLSWSRKRQATELEPEELAAYVRRAEKQVLPLLKKARLDAGTAQFLLAQYTQAIITDNAPSSLESTITIANSILAIWQEGYYIPNPEYPYTLEETLQSGQEEPKTKTDYAGWFHPFTPEKADFPRGLGEIPGGIVKHPETHLWQIWTMIDGTYAYFGAYYDPVAAQRGLGELVSLSRRGASQAECFFLCRKLSSRGDGMPKPIPHEMMVYLRENLEHYTILL